ncbi:hypothetical protein D3C72_1620040 [compost metagenome]
MGQFKFEFWLREKVKREPHVETSAELRARELGRSLWTPRFDFIPLDEFELGIGNSSYPKVKWADSASRSLEEQLGEFAAALEVLAEEACEAQIRAAEEARHAQIREAEARLRAEEEHRRQQKIKMRRKAEEARVQDILLQAKTWRESRDLRGFIVAVEAAARGAGLSDTSLLKDWLTWASSIADRLDPTGFPAAMLSRWAETAPACDDD